MRKSKKIMAVLLAACTMMIGFSSVDVKASEEGNISYGVDVGWLSQFENAGVSWVDDNGTTMDALQILKNKGVDSVRIRAFVNPDSSFEWTKPDGTTCMLGVCGYNWGAIYGREGRCAWNGY